MAKEKDMEIHFHDVRKIDRKAMKMLSEYVGLDLRQVKRMETYVYNGKTGKYEGVRLSIEMK